MIQNQTRNRVRDVETHETAPPEPERIVNISNALCVIRLIAAAFMVGFAIAGNMRAFLVAFVVAALSDWLDGKFARLLNQQTSFGARIDSIADFSMFFALLFGAVCWKPDVVLGEWPWIAAAIVTSVASIVAGRRRFGRWPSYHTWMAKLSWFLIAIGAIAFFADWSLWPLRIALAAVALTNIEEILITFTLEKWISDVPTVFHARKAGGAKQPSAPVDRGRPAHEAD
jgi:CDP-diacylglycerol--glycerol-3-phosphate 3-phosphatidyltransferase